MPRQRQSTAFPESVRGIGQAGTSELGSCFLNSFELNGRPTLQSHDEGDVKYEEGYIRL